jgi:cytochrome c biogenesis protein CcdA/thiol-disulfide isomerase/thioredoxin
MLVLLGVAFLAGVITAISPCVLPVLPIILAGSATSANRMRPFAIVTGLVLSFTTFTLAGAAILSALALPEDVLRDVAIAALLLLAVTLVSRKVAWLVERPFLFLTRKRVSADSNGLLLGLSLGLVFVPCAGPVLAAVTALAASGEVGARVVLVTGVYALGAAFPMLAIAIGGQRLTSGLRFLRAHTETTRRAAGVVLGATAIAIAFGADQRFTTAIPGYTEALQERIERSSAARQELRELNGGGQALASSSTERSPRAPEFRGIERWLNTPGGRPVSIRELRGKVVLVDFWTYSCINCLRTLPHVKAWDRTYRRDGLVVVGVHSPEFAFERVPDNVRSATRRLGVRYPVGLDNDFATWRAYQNDYWPAKYLVDRDGRVRFTHFGEGAYGETESWIRRLLGEKVHAPPTSVADETPTAITTPESYLGYARLDRFASPRIAFDVEASYSLPARELRLDELAYAGRWKVEPARIVAGEGARLNLRFQARDVFLVIAGEGTVQVRVDGRPPRTVFVSGTPRLYTLARFPQLTRALLELRFSPGLAGYAFTFG